MTDNPSLARHTSKTRFCQPNHKQETTEQWTSHGFAYGLLADKQWTPKEPKGLLYLFSRSFLMPDIIPQFHRPYQLLTLPSPTECSIFWLGLTDDGKKRGNRPPFFGRIPTCNTNKTRRLPRRE